MANVSLHSHIVPSTNEANNIARVLRDLAGHVERSPLSLPLEEYLSVEECVSAVCLALVNGDDDELDAKGRALLDRLNVPRALVARAAEH